MPRVPPSWGYRRGVSNLRYEGTRTTDLEDDRCRISEESSKTSRPRSRRTRGSLRCPTRWRPRLFEGRPHTRRASPASHGDDPRAGDPNVGHPVHAEPLVAGQVVAHPVPAWETFPNPTDPFPTATEHRHEAATPHLDERRPPRRTERSRHLCPHEFPRQSDVVRLPSRARQPPHWPKRGTPSDSRARVAPRVG